MAKRWTPQEKEYVDDYAGIKNYTELSQRLNRSEDAIRLFRARNRLSSFFDNFYTYNLLSKELGLSRATIRKYHLKGWLQGRRANWKTIFGKYPMIFTEDNIVKFLKSYANLFSNRIVPNIYFRNIVLTTLNGNGGAFK